jgi:hypothetical protein
MLLKRLLRLISKKNLNAKIRNIIAEEIDKFKFVSVTGPPENPGNNNKETYFQKIDNRQENKVGSSGENLLPI